MPFGQLDSRSNVLQLNEENEHRRQEKEKVNLLQFNLKKEDQQMKLRTNSYLLPSSTSFFSAIYCAFDSVFFSSSSTSHFQTEFR